MMNRIRSFFFITLIIVLSINALTFETFGQTRQRRTNRRPVSTPNSTPSTQQNTKPQPPMPEVIPDVPMNLPPPPPAPTPKPLPPPPQTEDEVIRTVSSLVVVPVSVTNIKGEPVQGLTVADFRLEEEGQVQQIDKIGDPEQVPIELVILLDVSSSTKNKFLFQQQAAANFIKQVLKPIDKVTVYGIGRVPRLVQTRTTSNEAASKLLTMQSTIDATAFYDTIAEAARYLKNSSPGHHRRVILAISDGEDNFSERFKTAIQSLPDVQRTDTIFYSINPSGQSLYLNKISVRGQQGMETIAAATGGAAFIVNTDEELPAVFRQIAAELRSQYLLQYYPKNDAKPGAFLRIKVTAPKQPSLRIRARQGYYSKKE
jgi:Ca-activated chloride channel homolog